MTRGWHIRPFAPADAPALTALYEASVRAIGPAHYTAAQVAAWAALAPAPEAFATALADGRLCLVAVEAAGRLLAFGDVAADGHIQYLYAAPAAARQGVTAALYAQLEAAARQQGIRRVYAEASEAALRFFLRQGFRRVRRRDFTVGGVAIHNYAVEKHL